MRFRNSAITLVCKKVTSQKALIGAAFHATTERISGTPITRFPALISPRQTLVHAASAPKSPTPLVVPYPGSGNLDWHGFQPADRSFEAAADRIFV